MVNSEEKSPTLGEAATRYLATLANKEREAAQAEVYKFARWVGWERPFSGLAGPAIAGYAEQLSVSDTDYARKFELVRGFLAYAKKAKWSGTNLATHLKTKKGKTAVMAAARMQESAALTQERYDEIKAELDILKRNSQSLMKDIQTAAADKDFRENAPLHAAREERGHVEGRIKELDDILKAATIIGEKKEAAVKSSIGDTILFKDLSSGEECRYVIVDPREMDPARGKISIASPLGKALLGKLDGQLIEINAPAGRLRFQIIRIER